MDRERFVRDATRKAAGISLELPPLEEKQLDRLFVEAWDEFAFERCRREAKIAARRLRIEAEMNRQRKRQAKPRAMTKTPAEVTAACVRALERHPDIRSRRELARRSGCSANAKALVRFWNNFRRSGGGAWAQPRVDAHIDEADAVMQRLIAEQQAELRAEGKPRRTRV